MAEKTVARTNKPRTKQTTKTTKTEKTIKTPDITESLISQEERRGMIAEAAYYRAKQRGFDPDGQVEDWLEAENLVDEMLSDAAKKAQF